MRDRRFLIGAVAVLGAAFIGAYYYSNQSAGSVSAAPVETGETTRVEVAVAGQANGTIVLELFNDVAPKHVERIVTLANAGAYDNVVFHRVIDGFMAQTGDVQFGKADADVSGAGRGGSDLPDLPAEFSDIAFERGMIGMARSQSENSANSQFFIMFAPATHLNGQYTIVGRVSEGLEILDEIKRGEGPNGAVIGAPDVMATMQVVQ